MLGDVLLLRSSIERLPSCEHLVEHHPEGVDVCLGIYLNLFTHCLQELFR